MSDPLPYAIPQPPPRPILVASVLGVFSLVLVILGGCFLIGVLVMCVNAHITINVSSFAPVSVPTVKPNFWTPGAILLAAMLYAAALACFAAALSLMNIAVKRLLKAS